MWDGSNIKHVCDPASHASHLTEMPHQLVYASYLTGQLMILYTKQIACWLYYIWCSYLIAVKFDLDRIAMQIHDVYCVFFFAQLVITSHHLHLAKH